MTLPDPPSVNACEPPWVTVTRMTAAALPIDLIGIYQDAFIKYEMVNNADNNEKIMKIIIQTEKVNSEAKKLDIFMFSLALTKGLIQQ